MKIEALGKASEVSQPLGDTDTCKINLHMAKYNMIELSYEYRVRQSKRKVKISFLWKDTNKHGRGTEI